MKFKYARLGLLIAAPLVAITLSQNAKAWPPTYGAEFELTDDAIQKAPEFVQAKASTTEEKKAQMRFVEHMRERCLTADCIVIEGAGKWDQDYTVRFSDGWWFKVSYDPKCVEITFKPSTLEELEKKTMLVNEQIFESGAQVGLKVREHETSHFNMGIRSAFDDSGSEFLKFYVDYQNHADLALGSLGHDIYNAPPLSLLGNEQREAMQNVVDEVNTGRMKSIKDVAAAIQNRVYTKSYHQPWGAPHHYQAVGLKYVNRTDLSKSDAPMELRAVWIQKSGEQFNLVSRLIEGRIAYLKRQQGPIVYQASQRKSFSPVELKTRFFIYVEEAGMKFSDFSSLLPESLGWVPLADFLNKDATMARRLKSINDYWDLVEISPWMREVAVHLLASEKAIHLPEAEVLMTKIKNATTVEVPAPKLEAAKPEPTRVARILNLFQGPEAARKPVIDARVTTRNAWTSMLHEIENKRAAAGVEPGPMCRALFN